MPKPSSHRTPGISRTATNRQGAQRKRAQKRRSFTDRLRDLEFVMAPAMPGRHSGGFSLPRLPQWTWPRLTVWGWSGLRRSKILSLLLLGLAAGSFAWTESNPTFYVYADGVDFGRLAYLNREELYARTDLEGLNVFWVQADQVQAQVRSHPYVTGATVQVRLPGHVQIAVQEASPVAIWVTDGGELWLLPDGTALGARTATRPDLVRIIDGPLAAHAPGFAAPGQGLKMDVGLLQSALTLAQTMPKLTSFRYAQGPGLYFTLPDSQTLVYWGDGMATEAKLKNLVSILRTLEGQGQNAQRIDVRYTNKPYYK